MTDNSLTAKKAEDVAQQSKKKRPRLFYLDLVRALAAILIVITHFNNPICSAIQFSCMNHLAFM